MGVYFNTAVGVFVDGFAFHTVADKVDLTSQFEEKDATVYASNGWRNKKVGLGQHMLAIEGFTDTAVGGVEPAFPITGLGGSNVFTIAPQDLAQTLADPCFLGQGYLTSFSPWGGAVGDLAAFQYGWAGTAQLVRGQIIHPPAARTATGNGTALAQTAPTASQSLFATFHVLSVSGAGSIQFIVETDTVIGMGTATTRITSQSFTAVGAQLASVAGAITGGFIRVRWIIAGFTSVTFAVASGVL